MKKRRISRIYFALLLLIMTACGRYEDVLPETSQGYESEVQEQILGTELPSEDAVENSQQEEPAGQESQIDQELPAGQESRAAQESQSGQESSAAQESNLEPEDSRQDTENDILPTYGNYYYDLTNVVLYLEVYDELPSNYITKNEARELGWEGGSVEKYLEGAAIGGDVFGNREGLLPEADGRSYTECDIDTNGYSSRGSRRLVFSNDGLYFYTSNHYETFSEVTVTEDYEVIW